MGLEGIIRKVGYSALINFAYTFISNKPERLTYLLDSLEKSDNSEIQSVAKFSQFVRDNKGPYELFQKLFTKNKKMVVSFFKNMIVNQGLDWLKRCEYELENDNFIPPYTVLISPTMRCNKRCVGCYASDYKKEDMSPKFFDNIINQAEDMGVHFFTILGGEPLMVLKNEEYANIVKQHKRSEFQFFTNSELMDTPFIRFLKKSGNLMPVISINGDKKNTDKVRGIGSYDKIQITMRRLKVDDIPFGVSVVLRRDNFDEIINETFWDNMINKGALFAWQFLYMPVGNNPDFSQIPNGEERKKAAKFVHSYRAKKPLFLMDFWGDAPYVGGCIAARKYMHITTDGDVEPCIFAHHAVDNLNLNDTTLREAWNSPYFWQIRYSQPHTDNLYRPCMIIDKPINYNDAVLSHDAFSTDESSDFLIENQKLEKYSESTKDVLDDFFDKEYSNWLSDKREKGKGTNEGFDRIWLEGLSDEMRKKYMKKVNE